MLALLLFAVLIVSLSFGAVKISFSDVLNITGNRLGVSTEYFSTQQEIVLLNIRLPRVLSGMVIGAALGIAGAAMQGLFRNPLVEPGLIGVSSGAALMAVVVIVFSAALPGTLAALLGTYLLPVFAFSGSLIVTWVVYRFSQRNGKTDIAILILSGVAINALCGALIGLIIYHADDMALRTFTFWNLGDLGGATWSKTGWVLIFILLPAVGLVFLHKSLDTLALGEIEAFYLGMRIERVKYAVIILTALTVGASVAVAGTIGFVGLVVPHILRTAFGPGHRLILPASLLTGAMLVTLTDLLARTVVAPSEIPIGVITALLGAPFFLALLIQAKKKRIL